MTVGTPRGVPDPGPYPSIVLGDVWDARTQGGVRVVAVRRSQVPLVHLRLQVPLGDVRPRDGTSLRLLPKMLLAGTGGRTGSEMAAAIQRIGPSIDASADADHLSLTASAPAGRLVEVLELLCEVVANPSFPRDQVEGERERVAQEVLQEASDPVAVATRALLGELYPGHPYADPLPNVASVRRRGRTSLVRFHAERVRPAGSTLVVVGDVDPDVAFGAAGGALGRWPSGSGAATAALDRPRARGRPNGIVVVHRPGAVQSNIRIGARCGSRHDPAFPALMLAMTVFGGSFSSRLVTNLRERNGYTYSPRAGIDERRLAAAATVRAEVSTDVTAKALAEVRYELARMATAGVTPEELETSRRYVTGVVAMASASQAALAGMLADLVADDLDPSYLEAFVRELAELGTEPVAKVAARSLAPVSMTTVVVGDADVVVDALSTLDQVKVVGR